MSKFSLTPYLTAAELFVAGSLHAGGCGILKDGDRTSTLRIPALLLALLAVLIEKAKHDEARDHEAWVPLGFMNAEQLFRALKGKKVAVDPKGLPRAIFRLRALFRRSQPLKHDFGMKFVEFQEGLGYRLSTKASLLHLDLTEEGPETLPG